jgi:hypothetical protein
MRAFMFVRISISYRRTFPINPQRISIFNQKSHLKKKLLPTLFRLELLIFVKTL